MATLSGITVFPIKSCHSVKVDSCRVDALGLAADRNFMLIEDDTNRFITQRKYASLALLQPVVDEEQGTLTLTSLEQAPLTLPLKPDISKLEVRKNVQLWKDKLTVYDMGDEAAAWVTQFLVNHREHDEKNHHNPEEKAEAVGKARLVTLDVPSPEGYHRPAHAKLPGPHSPFTDWSPVSLGFESSLASINDALVSTGTSGGQRIPIDRFRNNLTIRGTLPWEEDTWLVAQIGEVTFYIIRPIARCTVPGVNQDTGIKDDWGKGNLLGFLREKRSFKESPNQGYFCVDAIPLTKGTIHVGDEIKVLERIPESHVAQWHQDTEQRYMHPIATN